MIDPMQNSNTEIIIPYTIRVIREEKEPTIDLIMDTLLPIFLHPREINVHMPSERASSG